jgi:catechol 2,3-dioxygenase-like lactoylglutathione lyase family enzyme
VALPCHNLDATIAWYEHHTPLRAFHRRVDVDAEVAWLAESPAQGGIENPVGIVVVQSFADRDAGVPVPVLTPFAHLGFEVDDPAEVDAIAERGRAVGCLHWEPVDHPPPVGYLCALADPDGNVVEFSHGQGLDADAS